MAEGDSAVEVVRELVLLFAGVAGIFYEMAIAQEVNPLLLGGFFLMTGSPALAAVVKIAGGGGSGK